GTGSGSVTTWPRPWWSGTGCSRSRRSRSTRARARPATASSTAGLPQDPDGHAPSGPPVFARGGRPPRTPPRAIRSGRPPAGRRGRPGFAVLAGADPQNPPWPPPVAAGADPRLTSSGMREHPSAWQNLKARRAALDRAAVQKLASADSPLLDEVLPGLSRLADHSVLWMAVAAGL